MGETAMTSPSREATLLRGLPAIGDPLPRHEFPTVAEAMEFGGIFAHAFHNGDARFQSEIALKCLMAPEFGISWRLGPSSLFFGDKGNLGMIAAAIRAAIRRSEKYDYRITEHDLTKCTMQIFDPSDKSIIATETYTIEDAERAKLTTFRWWEETPKAMLLARVTSICHQAHCPDVFSITMYDRDEVMEANIKQRREPEAYGGKSAAEQAKAADSIRKQRHEYFTLHNTYCSDALARGIDRTTAKAQINSIPGCKDADPIVAITAIKVAIEQLRKLPLVESATPPAAVASTTDTGATVSEAALATDAVSIVSAAVDEFADGDVSNNISATSAVLSGEGAERELESALADSVAA